MAAQPADPRIEVKRPPGIEKSEGWGARPGSAAPRPPEEQRHWKTAGSKTGSFTEKFLGLWRKPSDMKTP